MYQSRGSREDLCEKLQGLCRCGGPVVHPILYVQLVNIWASTVLPWDLKITKFAKACKEAQYEPEIHSAVIYQISEPK